MRLSRRTGCAQREAYRQEIVLQGGGRLKGRHPLGTQVRAVPTRQAPSAERGRRTAVWKGGARHSSGYGTDLLLHSLSLCRIYT